MAWGSGAAVALYEAPAAVAGHSLGEYSALVAVGALPYDHGVRLVAERGDAMAEAAENRPGTMAAVLGLDVEHVDVACRRADADVWLANDNAPGQVVIAGDAAGVTRAGEIAKELGAKRVMGFPVGGAFHTPLMAPARDRLREALKAARFADADIPVIANVDAEVHQSAADWPQLLSAQLCSPVRWRQTMSELGAMGVTQLVEVGPGGVLTGLAKRGLPGVGACVSTPADVDGLLAAMAPIAHLSDHPLLNDGEHLFVRERLVVSPAAGVFVAAAEAAATGTVVEVGGLLERSGRRHRGAEPLPRRDQGHARHGRRARHRGAADRLAAGRVSRMPPTGARRGAGDAAAASPSPAGGWPSPNGGSPTTTSSSGSTPPTPGSPSAPASGAARRPGATTAGLATEAGGGRHRRRRPGPADIGMLILATGTLTPDAPHRRRVQEALGLRCGAFDLDAACSGFVYGLVVAPHGRLGRRRPGARHRLGDAQPGGRPRRPRHERAVRRRRRRGGARPQCRPSACCPGTSAATGPLAGLLGIPGGGSRHAPHRGTWPPATW